MAIDYAIVSHFHADHMGGFADLLRAVFVLDDSDETMRIKSIHGPYTSQ